MGSAIVSPHALPVLLLQALLSCVALGADNSGSVTFYTGAAFTGVQRRVYFDSTDVCVNVQCVQDSVRSITWSQLYGDGSVNDETPTQIEFFAGADCTGVSTKYNTFAPTTPSEFAKKTVDHSVLSFAVHTEGTALQSLSVEAQCTVVEQPLDAKTTISFPGQLMLHDLPFEGGREASVPIAIAQRCYDIDVPSEFQLSSVSWTKMSDRSSLNRNGQSMVYLFNDPGCDGLRRRFFSLYNQTSGDFQSTGLTRLGSFMLMQSSPFVLGTPIKLKPTIDSSTFPTTASFGWVTLSAGRSSDSSLRERKYQVNKMETCYSLACFGSQATRAVWSNLPTEGSFHGRQDALIAFYSDTSCRNRQGSPVSISAGEINVTKSPDYEGFQSLMVWVNTNETSEPPIDDICDGSSTKQPNAQVPHESSDNAALLSGILVGAAAVGIVGVVFWYRRRLRSISDSKQQSLTSTCELDLDEAIRDNYITAADVRLVVCVSKTDNALVYSGIFTNQVVTVKQLGSTDDIARENFLYEVKVAAQLDHLKIVCLIGVYWTNSSHVFSVFEHMEEDIVHGTEQKFPTIWTAILDIFEAAQPSDSDDRSAQALRNRWYTISHDVAKFVGCYAIVESRNESCKCPED
ncbi:TPA: hypothetical protein N0F65_000868 [Lagenidium giganteum]|uniref:Protein kinase domain-containing protein n=1 Tax=Lagenidium giganteum TaxID=4803 RepID=A0AAV2YZV9_9STRA|nr:TPA: hypothetical protein N0F65_000868 [Lagenidium giganteum]